MWIWWVAWFVIISESLVAYTFLIGAYQLIKLAVGLSKLFPDNLILGMEIRTKVVEYVQQRIGELREKNAAAKGTLLPSISMIDQGSNCLTLFNILH
jgi:hypothetical protein